MSTEPHQVGPFFILAIDGGGVRGIYAAHILRRMKDALGVDLAAHFDLIAGTSTGSIIAAALATDVPIEDVVALYEREAPAVFAPRWSARGIARSMYSKSHLGKVLGRVFGDKTLSDARTRLLIPATDISNGCVHVFKSSYDPGFVRDKHVKVCAAVLASCSAPIYFDPERVDEYLIADGGLWANNPSLTALVEALSRLKVPREQIRILSIGTGRGHESYPVGRASGAWGALGWDPRRLVDLILSLQSASAGNMLQLLLPSDQRLRLDFELSEDLRLDAYGAVGDLKARADRAFTHNSAAIRSFLGL